MGSPHPCFIPGPDAYWSPASKNYQKWLRSNKKRPQQVLQGQQTLGTFLLISFLSRISANVFEINEDRINKKINVVVEFYAMFFLFMLKKM